MTSSWDCGAIANQSKYKQNPVELTLKGEGDYLEFANDMKEHFIKKEKEWEKELLLAVREGARLVGIEEGRGDRYRKMWHDSQDANDFLHEQLEEEENRCEELEKKLEEMKELLKDDRDEAAEALADEEGEYDGDENFNCPVHYGSYGAEGECICGE